MKFFKTWGFLIISLASCLVGVIEVANIDPHKPLVFLYAWQRPEDLSFLHDQTQVAYLAGSITFKNGQTQTSPRLQPLKTNTDTQSTSVVRIDDLDNPPQLNNNMIDEASKFILELCDNAKAGCQIDFDARSSERDFYSKLLTQVRQGLDPRISLSITALLSWCDSHSWIDKLPITEAVPMFYRIGPETNLVRQGLTGASFMQNPKCQRSIAISLDEPLPSIKYLKNRNIYIFNPKSWTADAFSGIMGLIKSR